MNRGRRVAVTSPQTRLAHARRRSRGRWRPTPLPPEDAERAALLYLRQRRRAVGALLLLFALLLGLPLVLAVFPGPDSVRLLGVPLSWLALALLPYPMLLGLARWQLRRAEDAEERR
ncbi:hypothetical protein [Gandjariella thermophila]|uniref:DUF485 domain-containing protein n=1 Tax=Gandjariella thermophila TaxID=1931992 RepID=A0A4D4JCC5_9PSEU|nr:hypothetical protein [Gandjariella thermophila]GDY31513.1 hypothetical protein GTS_31460 [Gandjariella thermophila]